MPDRVTFHAHRANQNNGPTMIKKLIGAVALMLTPCTATFAAEGAIRWTRRLTASTTWLPQNGAKLFVNYRPNCHSASSMRYNKLKDIGPPTSKLAKACCSPARKSAT